MTDAAEAVTESPTFTQPRATVADARRAVQPDEDEAVGAWQWAWMTAAGIFRLATIAATTAVDKAVSTRFGAAIGLLVLLASCLTSCTVRALS